jgi:hypothetical protein
VRTEKIKLIFAFCNFKNMPKKERYISSSGTLCHWVLGSDFGDTVVVPYSNDDTC